MHLVFFLLFSEEQDVYKKTEEFAFKKMANKEKERDRDRERKKKREFVFVEKSSRLLRVMKAPSSCVSERLSYNHTHEVHIHNHRQHVVEANAD